MSNLIKNGRITTNEWKTLTLADGETAYSVKLPAGNVLVPAAVWRARRPELIHSEYEHGWLLGVWLAADEGPEAIVRDIEDFSVIAIEFNRFTDGKGYSTARQLRERYGYRSELRAIGDVPRDTFQLQQFGFDAFELAAGKRTSAVSDFNLHYAPARFAGLQPVMAAG